MRTLSWPTLFDKATCVYMTNQVNQGFNHKMHHPLNYLKQYLYANETIVRSRGHEAGS